MKTIKQGEKPEPMKPGWVGQQVTCGRCNSIYELEVGDPVYTYRQINRYPATTEAHLSCPCCSASIKVIPPASYNQGIHGRGCKCDIPPTFSQALTQL